MSLEREVRTYRTSRRRLGLAALFMGIGALGLVFKIGGDPTLTGTVKFWMLVPALSIIGLALLCFGRSATILDLHKITIRGPLRRRILPWTEVQDLRVEANPGRHASAAAPTVIATVYDRRGRRIPLPNINEKNLRELDTDLAHEVETIRGFWLRGRGTD